MKASSYSAIETLRDGRRMEIRAQRPTDRKEIAAAVWPGNDLSPVLRSRS
jgi:hypothetical protein